MENIEKKPPALWLRLFGAFALVTVLAAALPAFFSRSSLHQARLEQAGKQAMDQAALLKAVLDATPGGALSPAQTEALFQAARAQALRLTLTGADGRVLKDTHLETAELKEAENHSGRPEIVAARSSGQGLALRHGSSLGLDAVYAAVLLESGEVLRVAAPLGLIERSLEEELSFLSLNIAGVALFCLLLSVLFTARVGKGIRDMAGVVESISGGGFQRRLRRVPGREFLPLARAVNRMAGDMAEYTATTAEQRIQLETILNSLSEGVLVLDRQGRIRRCNLAMEELFPGACAALGLRLDEALPLTGLWEAVEELLAEDPAPGGGPAATAPGLQGRGEDPLHFEYPAGRFLVAHLSPPAGENASIGAVIVFYNATELTRLERVRRDFVANVSHELRTPLTAIAGSAEILAESPEMPGGLRGFAEVILRHSAMLSRLVSDLLALARVENNGQSFALGPVDCARALRDALALSGDGAGEKGLILRPEVPEGLLVKGNAALLTQVFRNLLENAFRLSPLGGEVLIRAETDGKTVSFLVADQGPGIPEEDLGRVFERFYQVDKGRSGAGSGLGLAICRHIVERHGGGIRAESPYGKYSTAMIFSLPRHYG